MNTIINHIKQLNNEHSYGMKKEGNDLVLRTSPHTLVLEKEYVEKITHYEEKAKHICVFYKFQDCFAKLILPQSMELKIIENGEEVFHSAKLQPICIVINFKEQIDTTQKPIHIYVETNWEYDSFKYVGDVIEQAMIEITQLNPTQGLTLKQVPGSNIITVDFLKTDTAELLLLDRKVKGGLLYFEDSKPLEVDYSVLGEIIKIYMPVYVNSIYIGGDGKRYE